MDEIDKQRYDVQLDGDNGLLFSVAGDFIIKPSDEQHIKDMINAAPCTWKPTPTSGVNIKKYLGGNTDLQELGKNLRLQLQSDLYIANPLPVLGTDGILYPNPNVTL